MMKEEQQEFKVGDEVVILSCGGHKTIIEKVDNDPWKLGNFVSNETRYWSRYDGRLLFSTADEMEHI
jgi:hypothetical protein